MLPAFGIAHSTIQKTELLFKLYKVRQQNDQQKKRSSHCLGKTKKMVKPKFPCNPSYNSTEVI